MIKVKNLSLCLGDLELFKDLNLNIEPHKITTIVGPNGAGKTSLMKALAGIIKPTSGQIVYQGTGKTPKTFYLPQKITYPGGINLFEYLESVFYASAWKWYIEKAEKLQIERVLKELELYDKKELELSKLSAGELQKANIALGLLSGADLLFLDEPTSNMDLINQMKILDILKHLKGQNLTSVVILHDLNLASNYGDYFIGISKESKTICAPKKEFFTPQALREIYNLEFKVISGEKNIFIQTFN